MRDGLCVVQYPRKGRGIVSSRRWRTGDVMLCEPVLVIPRYQVPDRALLSQYVFHWDRNNFGLILGIGSLCNHALAPNADVEFDHAGRMATLYALRTISRGDEVTIDYTSSGNEEDLWFDVY